MITAIWGISGYIESARKDSFEKDVGACELETIRAKIGSDKEATFLRSCLATKGWSMSADPENRQLGCYEDYRVTSYPCY